MLTRQDIKVFLSLLDELCIGTEKSITDPGDYSGCNTEYVLNSEAFRANIQNKLDKVEQDIVYSDDGSSGKFCIGD